MSPNITPLPWRTNDSYDHYVEDKEGRAITECHFDDGITLQQGMRNAAYIAKSANAYPQLVEALKDLIEFVDEEDSKEARALLSTLEESK
jgi:hypothetical protein